MDETYRRILPMFPTYHHRANFMTECFELVYHGNGGFNWNDVWNMPVPHRKFNLKKINEHLQKMQEMRDEQNRVVTENTNLNKINLPKQIADKLKQPTFVSNVKGKK
jgi:hypothetical protein